MEKCYYRQKPPQGYPVDYYMWPKEQKNCKGKETCAPKRPKPLTKKEEIDEFFKKVQEKVSPHSKRLPVYGTELKDFLASANITWLKRGATRRNSGIVGAIQREIDSTPKNQDIFLLIGTGHGLPGQVFLVNEILKKIKGVTLFGIEDDSKNNDEISAQELWDYYLLGYNFMPAYSLSKDATLTTQKEIDFMNLRPPIMRKKCYGVIAPNMSEQEKAEAGRLPDGYFDTMREIYAAMSIQQKVNDKKRNVVVVEHGSAHMHRGRLPAFIKYFNPDAKVFVVILDGDRHLPTMLFDKTVKELGWEDRNFILRLGPDFLEGDLVVHLATRGREQEQSRIPSPGILIHTYQPLP